MADVTDSEREFHLAEFAKLNGEIGEYLKSTADLLRWTTVSSAAVFAWLLAQGSKAVAGGSQWMLTLAFAIPFVMSLAMALLAQAQAERMGQIGAYLARLEALLGHTGFGWEEHFRDQTPVTGKAYQRVWYVLLASNLLLGLLGAVLHSFH
jgi:hypothetical protein